MSFSDASPLARPLEGPGAETRLRTLQRRFQQAAPGAPRPLSTLALIAISLATFAAVLTGGLWLLG